MDFCNIKNYTSQELKLFLKNHKQLIGGNKTILINKVLKYIENKPYIIECGGEGNCLFHVISFILNELLSNEKKYDSDKVRKLTAKSINNDNVNSILENYLIDYKNHNSEFLWNPEELNEFSIEQKTKELKSIIKTDGYIYEGDMVSLSLLSNSDIFKKHKLGIIIFTDHYNIHTIPDLPYIPEIYGIIYNVSNIHWQLIGMYDHKNNKNKILFSESEMDYIFENFDSTLL